MAGDSGNHSSAHRGKQALPNSLGNHSWAVRSPDIRKKEGRKLGTRMPGSRKLCPVAVEV